MSDQADSPTQHLLPGTLPPRALARLEADLESVRMSLGQVMYEAGGQLKHVYFPTTSIVTLLYVMEDGASAEIAVVGNEGILGISYSWEMKPLRVVQSSRAKVTHFD